MAGAGPPQDPQILFLVMAQYSSANLQNDGVEFFSARLKEFGPNLTDAQKSLYLSMIGLLRAQNASSVSLLHRIGYVKRHDRDTGTSAATFARADLRRELTAAMTAK